MKIHIVAAIIILTVLCIFSSCDKLIPVYQESSENKSVFSSEEQTSGTIPLTDEAVTNETAASENTTIKATEPSSNLNSFG